MAEKKVTKSKSGKATAEKNAAGKAAGAQPSAKKSSKGKAGQQKGKQKETGAASRTGPFSTSASLMHVRISPRKMRLVVELIKGKQVEPALQILKFSNKKGANLCNKLLMSAITNAKERGGVNVDNLWVLKGEVSMGRTIKRYMPRAQGRATPIRKRSAHVKLVVGERA